MRGEPRHLGLAGRGGSQGQPPGQAGAEGGTYLGLVSPHCHRPDPSPVLSPIAATIEAVRGPPGWVGAVLEQEGVNIPSPTLLISTPPSYGTGTHRPQDAWLPSPMLPLGQQG